MALARRPKGQQPLRLGLSTTVAPVCHLLNVTPIFASAGSVPGDSSQPPSSRACWPGPSVCTPNLLRFLGTDVQGPRGPISEAEKMCPRVIGVAGRGIRRPHGGAGVCAETWKKERSSVGRLKATPARRQGGAGLVQTPRLSDEEQRG